MVKWRVDDMDDLGDKVWVTVIFEIDKDDWVERSVSRYSELRDKWTKLYRKELDIYRKLGGRTGDVVEVYKDGTVVIEYGGLLGRKRVKKVVSAELKRIIDERAVVEKAVSNIVDRLAERIFEELCGDNGY